MTDEERADTIARLERLAKIKRNVDVRIQATPAQPGVMFGYAFNISKCKGYRACVRGLHQREQPRSTGGHPVHPHLRDGG